MKSIVDYLKTNRMSYGYWAFNPNSGITGGLVQSDWRTPERAKLDALAPILTAVPAVSVPVPTATATASPTSSPAPTASPTPTPAPTSGPAITAGWRLTSSWNGGYVANLDVTALRSVSVWSVSWNDPNVTSIANSWGIKCTVVPKASITCTGSDWTTKLAAGQKATVGLQVNSLKAPVNPVLTVK